MEETKIHTSVLFILNVLLSGYISIKTSSILPVEIINNFRKVLEEKYFSLKQIEERNFNHQIFWSRRKSGLSKPIAIGHRQDAGQSALFLKCYCVCTADGER
jgi:hypothetical protein